MSDIHVARGCGFRPLGLGAKLSVVIVDFQRGFTEAAFPMEADRWSTKPIATPSR